MTGTNIMETIEETTVGHLGDCRVAMASMVFDDEYTLPNGSSARGLICVLVAIEPEGEKVWVGKGSIATIHGANWEVVNITKEPGENGSITLKQLV